MKRTTSSNSETPSSYFESPHSPLRFHSPLSDAGDPPESRYVSPEGSPFKIENPKPIVTEGKFTQFTPLPSPIPPPPPQFPPRHQRNARAAAAAPPPTNSSSSEKSPSSMVVFNRWVREEGPQTRTRKVGESATTTTTTVNRARRDELVGMAALGFRVSQVILCVISFSIMAADKTQGWSGDSYDRYKEYRSLSLYTFLGFKIINRDSVIFNNTCFFCRYCLAVNVIAFIYSTFEACDAACYISKETYLLNCGFHDIFVFSMDQVSLLLLTCFVLHL